MRMKKNTLFPFLIVLLSLLVKLYAEQDTRHQRSNLDTVHEIQVGVILDMGSSVGKVVHSCITMAISDFYDPNRVYKTKVVLNTRDSKGEPLHALSAAYDLLVNVKVQAILGPETSLGGEFLPLLSDKARVPIIYFSTSCYSNKYPYFVQIRPDETTEFKGISAILESFRWRNVIIVYEDTDYGREIPPNLANSLADTHITYMSAISPSATDDQIHEELHKLMSVQTTIFIAHMSPSLATRFFLNVKRLGMMTEGYVWILTGKTTNLLHSVNAFAIESMQGALGFKSYVPASIEFHNFTVRWKKKFHMESPDVEVAELNILGLWAYDTVWALARAVERVGFENPPTGNHSMGLNLTDLPNIGATQSGSILLNEILKTRFTGLSGKFQFMNGRLISEAFEVVNVIGSGERRVGYWNATAEGMYRCIDGMLSCVENGLETIIWPGGSTTSPKGWLMRMGVKKLRIGVPQSSGFKELVHVDRDPQTNATIVTGFCIDVFNSAIEALPYEVPYEFIRFEGLYQDLIDQVYLRNFDAVVGDVTITANRSLYVDFTSTFTDVGIGTVEPIGNKKNMWVFLKPLDADLWITSAGFFILIGFVIWIVEHPINEAFQGSRAQQFGTTLWFSFSTLVFAHREKLSSNLSKFVVIVWVFVVLILTSSYTATLTSMLTIQQIQLASKGSPIIGYQGGSLVRGIIRENLNFTDPMLKFYSSPEEYADALSSGSIVAMVNEIPYLKIFLAKYPVDYVMVASQSSTSGFGFVFQKGSPLVPEISREIMKLREGGKLQMLENAWFKSSSSLMSTQDVVTNPNTLGLDGFRGLFLISGISLALVLAIRLINFLHRKWHEKISNFMILAWGKLMFLLKYLPSKYANMIAERNAR